MPRPRMFQMFGAKGLCAACGGPAHEGWRAFEERLCSVCFLWLGRVLKQFAPSEAR